MLHLNLRNLRQNRRLSLDQLSNLSGINRATIYRIEAGTVSPRIDTLQAICDALGVELFDLFGDPPLADPGQEEPPAPQMLPAPQPLETEAWSSLPQIIQRAVTTYRQTRGDIEVRTKWTSPLPLLPPCIPDLLDRILQAMETLALHGQSPAPEIHITGRLQQHPRERCLPFQTFHSESAIALRFESPAGGPLPASPLTLHIPLQTRPNRRPTLPEDGMTPDPFTLLIAEDNDMLRTCMAEYIRLIGHVAIEARNGQEAVDHYAQHGASIDLVIMDINMPVMNGLTAIREIRKRGTHPRIVVASGAIDSGDLKELGIVNLYGFLRKPFSLQEILFLIEQLQARHMTS